MTNESWKNPWKFGGGRDGSRDRDPGRDGPRRGELGGRESDKKALDVSPGRATPLVATSPAAPTTAGVPTQSARRSTA